MEELKPCPFCGGKGKIMFPSPPYMLKRYCGYFVCVAAMPGTAKRTWDLCRQLGVTLTNAGATHPYGIDPEDSMIRIAPSYPPIEELEAAMEVFCVCLKIAALEKYLDEKLV